MSALPRGTCPDCAKSVAVRRNGDLREHYVYRPQAEQEPEKPMGRVRVCVGSGKRSSDEEAS